MLYLLFVQRTGGDWVFNNGTPVTVMKKGHIVPLQTRNHFEINEFHAGQKGNAIENVLTRLDDYGIDIGSSDYLDKFIELLENDGIYDDENKFFYRLVTVDSDYNTIDIINDNVDMYENATTVVSFWEYYI